MPNTPPAQGPRISLLICAHNEESYIRACLESVLRNAAGMFYEIIVVDNASTDRTAAIVRTFRSQNVRLVHEPRKGLTRARQRAFREARGDILAFIDADTLMPKNWFARVQHAFTTKDIVCISGPYFYYDAPTMYRLGIKLYWLLLALPSYWFIGYMVVGGNFAIKRTVLQQIDGFDQSITFYGEDTDIARRAAQCGKVYFDHKLVMPSSARRLRKEHYIKIMFVYIINFLSVTIFKKPFTQQYDDIR